MDLVSARTRLPVLRRQDASISQKGLQWTLQHHRGRPQPTNTLKQDVEKKSRTAGARQRWEHETDEWSVVHVTVVVTRQVKAQELYLLKGWHTDRRRDKPVAWWVRWHISVPEPTVPRQTSCRAASDCDVEQTGQTRPTQTQLTCSVHHLRSQCNEKVHC